MKILYFSSTGNCFYLAKRLGGELISIPKLIQEGQYCIEDEIIGIIFPVYGLCIPPFVEEFMDKAELETEYLFGIATYGFFSGAVCNEMETKVLGGKRRFDYINKIKMAENCITFADMAVQKGDSDKLQQSIESVIHDISVRKKYVKPESFIHRFMTQNHKKNFGYKTGIGITDKLSINDSCQGCGMCVKICPTGNIGLIDDRPQFGKNCVSCGGCLQNCPAVAIHHSEEKSGARYRNPHVKAEELFNEVNERSDRFH